MNKIQELERSPYWQATVYHPKTRIYECLMKYPAIGYKWIDDSGRPRSLGIWDYESIEDGGTVIISGSIKEAS